MAPPHSGAMDAAIRAVDPEEELDVARSWFSQTWSNRLNALVAQPIESWNVDEFVELMFGDDADHCTLEADGSKSSSSQNSHECAVDPSHEGDTAGLFPSSQYMVDCDALPLFPCCSQDIFTWVATYNAQNMSGDRSWYDNSFGDADEGETPTIGTLYQIGR